jgi:hypothetical protein
VNEEREAFGVAGIVRLADHALNTCLASIAGGCGG